MVGSVKSIGKTRDAIPTEPSAQVDLSVVVNVHDDAIDLWRTLRSTEEAARYARHEVAR